MSIFLSLEKNTKGRDFIIGDIHGAYDLVDEALERVKFDPEKDRLISVGDLIDRGPDSYRCLEFLEKPWFHAVKGNHEDLLMDMCDKDGNLDDVKAQFNIRNGMGWVIDLTKEERLKLVKAFKELPIAMEIETERGSVGVVHADVPKNMSWKKFIKKLKTRDPKTTKTALWGRSRINKERTEGVKGIDRIFFGHTTQDSGPKKLGNCYYIDTGAVFHQLLEDDDYFLTMADIACQTQVLKRPANDKGLLTQKPKKPKKPFGKYNR